MGNEVTGTVDEKDANVINIKSGDGADVRYVKESDLLAAKGSKEGAVEKATREATEAAQTAHATEVKVATDALDTEKNKALQAEAKISSLEETIRKGGGTAEELATAKQELETAKTSSESLGTKYLELKRDVIIKTYGVPKETVEGKNLAALDVYEEALKAVIGDKALGNFAIGGGGGGAQALQGKSPMELAQMAYSTLPSK